MVTKKSIFFARIAIVFRLERLGLLGVPRPVCACFGWACVGVGVGVGERVGEGAT